jgi:hypothetical protein
LHPSEKTLAQKMADDAKARGITNPDGSPITVDQIENAMRSADNSQYGETITTGMAVPLSGSTKSSQLYATTGMLVTNDGAGNNYLVQNPSMFGSPSDTLCNLIQQDSGGANSPYSWNLSSPHRRLRRRAAERRRLIRMDRSRRGGIRETTRRGCRVPILAIIPPSLSKVAFTYPFRPELRSVRTHLGARAMERSRSNQTLRSVRSVTLALLSA